MTKNCELCGRKFPDTDPRRRFCSKRCRQYAWRNRLPNAGHGKPTWETSRYWLTAKGYRALGKDPLGMTLTASQGEK